MIVIPHSTSTIPMDLPSQILHPLLLNKHIIPLLDLMLFKQGTEQSSQTSVAKGCMSLTLGEIISFD